jgi:hypothetical protein
LDRYAVGVIFLIIFMNWSLHTVYPLQAVALKERVTTNARKLRIWRFAIYFYEIFIVLGAVFYNAKLSFYGLLNFSTGYFWTCVSIICLVPAILFYAPIVFSKKSQRNDNK